MIILSRYIFAFIPDAADPIGLSRCLGAQENREHPRRFGDVKILHVTNIKPLNRFYLSAVIELYLTDAQVVEIAGTCGVDFLWLCFGHVPYDWFKLENTLRDARLQGLDTLVRFSKGPSVTVARPFEGGPTSIIAPKAGLGAESQSVFRAGADVVVLRDYMANRLGQIRKQAAKLPSEIARASVYG